MAQSIIWVVLEQKLPGGRTRLVSKHENQKEAEAECDRRNSGRAERPLSACILLSPWRSAWEGTRRRPLQPSSRRLIATEMRCAAIWTSLNFQKRNVPV